MFHPQASLTENVRTEAAFIAPGKYIDIDEKIYEPQPAIDETAYKDDSQYRGIDYSYNAPIEPIKPEQIRLNYGTYFYNQTNNSNGPIF